MAIDVAPAFGDPDHGAAIKGVEYKDFLATLHNELVPQSYFEIGTEYGDTLALANCLSVAVDPAFQLKAGVIGTKPGCLLFQETSDDFFAARDLTAILGVPVDLAFLDGMHRAEYLLRDFMNTEKHCHHDSLVVLHDCLPPGFLMTNREKDDPRRRLSEYPDYWTGDVWQLVPILQRFRPDLSITLADSFPTGLVLITRLDPGNNVLAGAYDEILAEHLPRLASRAAYDAYWEGITIAPSEAYLADLLITHSFAPELANAAWD